MSRRRLRPQPARNHLPGHRGADLHVHTTHSDGLCSPGEVVRSAAAVGLVGVAITDHDTLSAIPVAQTEADRLGIELIPGVELSASDGNREVHILGLFVDPTNSQLVEATTWLREARQQRFEKMLAQLARLGLRVDSEALRRTFPRAALGRKHLADYLVRSGQVATHRLVFTHYLGDDGPANVAKPTLPVAEMIALIREAGGVAGLPHPPHDLPIERLIAYREAGLVTLEVDGPGIDRQQSRRRRIMAERFGLVPIAGTDFHAPDRPGRWVGAISTPIADLERLRHLAIHPEFRGST